MKNIPAVATALREDAAVKAVPEVIIDWNMNRYVDVVADNTPAEIDSAFDGEYFPIESIVEPLRPTKGINKARVGAGTVSDDYLDDTQRPRYYVADVDDPYKYWTSPDASNASTGTLGNCKPQVVYGRSVDVNKIVLTFENSWASPSTFSIQTTTNATPTDANWTEIANQTSVGNTWKGSGQIVLYYNGTAWVTTGRVDNDDKTPKTQAVRGVRVVVTALEGGYQITTDGTNVPSTYAVSDNGTYQTFPTNGRDARCDVIEISARLEVDLSPYVISDNDDSDMGSVSPVYPIGTITTNQGSLTLSNLYETDSGWETGFFNADNADSPYADYIDANAKVTLKYRYLDEEDNLLGVVNQFTMYTDEWAGQDDESVEVSLSDHSKFFDSITVRPAMWEGLTVPEIVWRILDSVGFNDHEVQRDADRVTEHVIPVFYTDGEQTVWEVLDELAQASQTAIYFDGNGKLQVKTRDFAFSEADAPVWDFTSETTDTQLANIIELTTDYEYEPNHYRVMYQKTNWSLENRGMPSLQKVWEPEGNVVLRGSPLARTLGVNDNYLYLTANDAKVWPYEGLVNLNAELIRYEGKEFVYYTGNNGNTRNVKVIKSQDEHLSRNSETLWQHRSKNHYTGALKITERGVWNSEAKRHPVDAEGYTARTVSPTTGMTGVAGFTHLRTQSKVRINTPGGFNSYKDMFIVTKGATNDTQFYYYGTKLNIKPSAGQPFAGIVIHNSGAQENGYFIEVTPSKYLTADKRKDRNELVLYSRSGGKDKILADEAVAIGEGLDYELDIQFGTPGSDHSVKVWLDGKLVINKTITGGDKQAANGKFGLFARYKTVVDFEYLYAVKKAEGDLPDDFSFMEKIRRGYAGDLWFREWVFKSVKNSRRVKKKTNANTHKVNERYMDDFGPYVHEVREFDVKFEPSPVLHSRLYLTNDWSATTLEYAGNPFGAKFLIANTYRGNAVINGEDTNSFAGTGDSINQVLTVFGRALVVEEAEELIVKNDDQIRRRGKIESELSSPWIQSKQMAKDLGDWMETHFSYGNDGISLEVFGNPLIEVGDVVHVTYPDKHVDDDYFVTGARNSFDAGLTTILALRRRVNI